MTPPTNWRANAIASATPHFVVSTFPIGIGGTKGVSLNLIRVARRETRSAKNWRPADDIRDELAAMGVVLKDLATGTTWMVA